MLGTGPLAAVTSAVAQTSVSFSAEEVLIAISGLVAEDFAAVVKVPSVH